jgi:hypothetical protein
MDKRIEYILTKAQVDPTIIVNLELKVIRSNNLVDDGWFIDFSSINITNETVSMINNVKGSVKNGYNLHQIILYNEERIQETFDKLFRAEKDFALIKEYRNFQSVKVENRNDRNRQFGRNGLTVLSDEERERNRSNLDRGRMR